MPIKYMVSNYLKGQHFNENGQYLYKVTHQMSYMSRQCVLQHLFFHATNYKTTWSFKQTYTILAKLQNVLC